MSPPACPTDPVDLQALVTAEVWFDGTDSGEPVLAGQLTRRPSRSGDQLYFEYSPIWLGADGAFAFDETLPLVGGPHLMSSADGAHALAPAFSDCSPDRWGTVLMDRLQTAQARATGRPVRNLRTWDYLLDVNDAGRMGALRMRDKSTGRWLSDTPQAAPPMASLVQLERVARAVDAGRDLRADEEVWLRSLVTSGSSLGGARPKAGFADEDGNLWLAKFPGANDSYDVGRWEFITWKLASMAGIGIPQARLLRLSDRGSTFAVRRFDRDEHGRIHYASAWTLLSARRDQAYSYSDIACAIEQFGEGGRIEADLEQLFRRVGFNMLVANRDDHLRNHGFLRYGNGWALSPAFDVNPNPHKDVHVLGVAGDDPGAGTAQLVADSRAYRLRRDEAERIIEEVRGAVAGWRDVARRAGAPQFELDMMAPVIDSKR